MLIWALAFEMTADDRSRIENLFVATGLVDSYQPAIWDVKTDTPNGAPDVVLLFGPRASSIWAEPLKEKGCLIVTMPMVKMLHPPELGGSSAVRVETFQKLKLLREDLETGHLKIAQDRKAFAELKVPALPDLSLQVIQAIEKALKESGRSTWMFRTKDGKVVALALDGKPVEGATVTLSIAEMMAIRAAQDVFAVQEIKIVPKG